MTTNATATPDVDHNPAQTGKGVFVFDVDGVTYQHDRPRITGAEIMAAAGIDPSVGLVQCFEDGTQQTIGPDDVVKLVPKPQFRKRPRFKRG